MNLMVLGATILPFSFCLLFNRVSLIQERLAAPKEILVSVDLTLKVHSPSGKQTGSHKYWVLALMS